MMNTGQYSNPKTKESLVIKIDEEIEENSIEEFTPHTPKLEKAKSGIKVAKM